MNQIGRHSAYFVKTKWSSGSITRSLNDVIMCDVVPVQWLPFMRAVSDVINKDYFFNLITHSECTSLAEEFSET